MIMMYTSRSGSRRGKSAQAYANIALESQVLGASPEQLITLLFEGAKISMAKAKLHMQSNNIAGRGSAISAAINIVDSGLKASVDQETGGGLAKNLVAIYELVIRHLLLANLNADMKELTLAEELLANVGDAWRTAVDPIKAETTSP